jgi:hypothetical protein
MEIIKAQNSLYVLCMLGHSIVMYNCRYLDYCMCHYWNMEASTKLIKKNINNKTIQTQNSFYVLSMLSHSIVMCMYKYLDYCMCHYWSKKASTQLIKKQK